MMKCEICGKEYKSIQPLSKHIRSYYNIDKKNYYDDYIKTDDEGTCHKNGCNNVTTFIELDKRRRVFPVLS